MRGLDTSVLVRYLTQDDPVQARRANATIAETVAKGDRLSIGVIVFCELVWVLREAYRLEKSAIVAALERILDTAQFVVEDKDLVRRALDDYRRSPGDFSDYLIGWRNQHSGCVDTLTFDRALSKSRLFAVL